MSVPVSLLRDLTPRAEFPKPLPPSTVTPRRAALRTPEMSATTAFGFAASPFLAAAPASPPRIIPRARLARPPPGAPAAFLAYGGSGSAMAEDATAVLYYCSRAPAPAQLRPDASSLLPHDYHRGPQRIADVGRYWAMPNLRPLKDTDDGKINAMKVASMLILGAVLGALIQSNVQASRDVAPTAGADVDVDTEKGYGYGYGYRYGYGYGYGYGHGYGDELEITTKRSAPEVEWREAEAARPTPKKLSESDNVLIRLLAKLGIGLKGVWDMLPG